MKRIWKKQQQPLKTTSQSRFDSMTTIKCATKPATVDFFLIEHSSKIYFKEEKVDSIFSSLHPIRRQR